MLKQGKGERHCCLIYRYSLLYTRPTNQKLLSQQKIILLLSSRSSLRSLMPQFQTARMEISATADSLPAKALSGAVSSAISVVVVVVVAPSSVVPATVVVVVYSVITGAAVTSTGGPVKPISVNSVASSCEITSVDRVWTTVLNSVAASSLGRTTRKMAFKVTDSLRDTSLKRRAGTSSKVNSTMSKETFIRSAMPFLMAVVTVSFSVMTVGSSTRISMATSTAVSVMGAFVVVFSAIVVVVGMSVVVDVVIMAGSSRQTPDWNIGFHMHISSPSQDVAFSTFRLQAEMFPRVSSYSFCP
mmetsp:Transcript_14442/g.34275  ORF Transcript_14442/g.34275 Transcript_14442/m.34275 type:complete len:300 (-) Transcript_14442:47-946(-)